MRKRGTRIALGLFALSVLLCGGWYLWNRPGEIPIPERRYPPDNACPKYVQIGDQLRARIHSDPRLKDIYRRFPDQPITDAERTYFLKATQPFMDAYARLVNDPCVAVYEYRFDVPLGHSFAGFREIARVESYHMRVLQQSRRWRELVERARRLLKFSHQIRNEGLIMHHLVGSALESLAVEPLRESFPQIDDPAALQAIQALAREYEQFRVPLHQVFLHEKYLGYDFYRQRMRAPRQELLADWRVLLGLEGEPDEVRLMREIVRVRFSGAPMMAEYERIWELVTTEAKKPYWKPVKPMPKPRYAINELLIPVYLLEPETRSREPAYVAKMRTLGCAAAVRLHKQRTGSYPRSLEALGLGETAIDPFTGKPLIYRVDAQAGFQLYSAGVNSKDDGGRAPYGNRWDIGDILPVMVPYTKRQGDALTAPLWLR